jgi:type IV secretory pathway TraG/TraD family ATPase VirD4
VVTSEPERERHLPKVRELLTLAEAPFEKLLDAMAGSQAAHGLVARAANRMKQKAGKERSGVVSTAQAHTHFLDSPRMAESLSRSDFEFSHLKTRRVSVYLVLPAERIPEYNRWLRLLVAVALNDLARTIGKPKKPVLFVLDEFAALGHMEAIETAMGLMAGFGVQPWPILQDLSQLKHIYGARWQTFLANCGALQAFNVAEHGTAEYFSSLLGKRTVQIKNLSAGRSGGYDTKLTKSIGESFSATSRPLLMPDEIMRLPSDETLIFIQGARPLRLKKLRYYAEPEFRGLFNRNPHRVSAVRVMPMQEAPAEVSSAKVTILPPPAKTILSYAVHAWAAEKGVERVQGFPKLPLATEWIPALFIIVHTEGWKDETKRLARLGMAMTSVPAGIAMSLDGAFSHPDFRAMLMDSLTDYAAKANLPTVNSEQPFWLWFAAAQRKREESFSVSA